jgi:hypothetical protein
LHLSSCCSRWGEFSPMGETVRTKGRASANPHLHPSALRLPFCHLRKRRFILAHVTPLRRKLRIASAKQATVPRGLVIKCNVGIPRQGEGCHHAAQVAHVTLRCPKHGSTGLPCGGAAYRKGGLLELSINQGARNSNSRRFPSCVGC